MKRIYKATVVFIGLLIYTSNCHGQFFKEYGVKSDYLGYGWIIAISDNLIFVPAKDSIRYPTVSRFFEEKNKFGFEISNYFHPPRKGDKPIAPHGKKLKIVWPKEGVDKLLIVPVMACYEWRDEKDLGGNQRAYKYQGRNDNVTYQIVSDFMFKYITLE